MERRVESYVAQLTISRKKIVYVEGHLDSAIVRDLFDQKKLNVRVSEANIAHDDSALPVEERLSAKNKVKKIVVECNTHPNLASKYLGVIDLDYDYFNDSIETIPNLLYTDFNSIESYFINLDLINRFLQDHGEDPLSEERLDQLLSNSLIFSSWFFFQISSFDSLNADERVSFDELSIGNQTFMDFGKCRFKLSNIVTYKTKCNDKEELKRKFISFMKGVDRRKIYDNRMKFLHGKYTFRFIVAIIKQSCSNQVRSLSEDSIHRLFKYSLLLFGDIDEIRLFKEILSFASSP